MKALRDDRFFMLETIREYALEQLEAQGEREEIRERHAEFFLALAQRANLNEESEGPMRHSLVIPEHNNVRAALEWATARCNGASSGSRLAIALENFWVTTDPVEGRRWIEGLLPSGPSPPSTIQLLPSGASGTAPRSRGQGAESPLRAEPRRVSGARRRAQEWRSACTRSRFRRFMRGDDAPRASSPTKASLRTAGSGFRKGEASVVSLLGDLERPPVSPNAR